MNYLNFHALRKLSTIYTINLQFEELISWLSYKFLFFFFITIAALQTYSAPMGNEKDGVDLRDTTYDGNTRLPSNQILENGLGKLTDDLYGTKDSLLSTNSGGLTGASPWVGYNTANPELTFHFRVPKIIKQVMVHVNNDNSNGKGISSKSFFQFRIYFRKHFVESSNLIDNIFFAMYAGIGMMRQLTMAL